MKNYSASDVGKLLLELERAYKKGLEEQCNRLLGRDEEVIANAVWGELRRQTDRAEWRAHERFVFQGIILGVREREICMRKIWAKVGDEYQVMFGFHEGREMFRAGPWFICLETFVAGVQKRVEAALNASARAQKDAEHAENAFNEKLAEVWLAETTALEAKRAREPENAG